MYKVIVTDYASGRMGFVSSVILNTKGALFQLEDDKNKAMSFDDYNLCHDFKDFLEGRFDIKVEIVVRD